MTDLFPDLPGSPLNQAGILAQWAVEQDSPAVVTAGFDLWNALYQEGGRAGFTGNQCIDAATRHTWWGDLNYYAFCGPWEARVLTALDSLLEMVETFMPDAAEPLAATGEGAAAQTARVRGNVETFIRETVVAPARRSVRWGLVGFGAFLAWRLTR